MSEKTNQPEQKMNERKMTCIMCPLSCAVTVKSDADGNITEILGTSCERGEKYIRDEFAAPRRMLTTTVGIEGAFMGRLPVRTSGYIPKDRMFDCMKEINKIRIKGMVKVNDVLIKDILGLGVDVIATKDLV